MKKTLAALAISGVIWFYPTQQGFQLGYDTDGDGVEDMRKCWHVVGQDPNGSYKMGLCTTWIDRNRDGKYTEDEKVREEHI